MHIVSNKTALFHITNLEMAGFQTGRGDGGYKWHVGIIMGAKWARLLRNTAYKARPNM